MKLKIILCITAIGVIVMPGYLAGQISYGGVPFNWDSIAKKDIGICGEYIIPTDLSEIYFEDSINAIKKQSTYRFGIEHEVNYTNENSGVFHYQPNGDRIWYLPLRSKGALAMSVRFGKFNLKPGVKVFIWDQKKEHFLGAFTHLNNKPWGSLATGLIGSDRIVVEVYEPKKTIGYNLYEIDQVVHAYRNVLSFGYAPRSTEGPFGDSGECNVNVSCPDGSGWENESSSVCLVVNGGTVPCTAVMVNNTLENEIPYVLTAEHCLNTSLYDWIFYFNFQSDECIGETGPIDQSVSGCTLVSSQEGADMALLLLSENPPSSYGICYSGWDNSDENDINSAMGIHHPNGDIKKLCIENDGLSQTQWQGSQTWQCDDWDLGVTEIGSSGSPLFNQFHQVIGTLSGGEAFCSGNQDNGQPDWYGRIGVAWDGNDPQSRLKDWLDPNGSGVSSINTYCPNAIAFVNDVQVLDLLNFPETLCDDAPFNPVIALKNNGQIELNNIEIAYQYNGNDTSFTSWNGTLMPGDVIDFILPTFYPQAGQNTIYVEALSVNTGILDENSNNNSFFETANLIVGSLEINVAVLTDDFGYETYWEIRNESGDIMVYGGNSDMGVDGAGEQSATPNDQGAYDDNTWYYDAFSIPQTACYEFEIADDFGDGICCDFGKGQYIITDNLGIVLAEGGLFGTNEISSFYMESAPTSINEMNELNFQVFPNPSREVLNIVSATDLSLVDIFLFNNLGQFVYSQRGFNGDKMVIDIKPFSVGLYTLELRSKEQRIRKKIIIQ